MHSVQTRAGCNHVCNGAARGQRMHFATTSIDLPTGSLWHRILMRLSWKSISNLIFWDILMPNSYRCEERSSEFDLQNTLCNLLVDGGTVIDLLHSTLFQADNNKYIAKLYCNSSCWGAATSHWKSECQRSLFISKHGTTYFPRTLLKYRFECSMQRTWKESPCKISAQ